LSRSVSQRYLDDTTLGGTFPITKARMPSCEAISLSGLPDLTPVVTTGGGQRRGLTTIPFDATVEHKSTSDLVQALRRWRMATQFCQKCKKVHPGRVCDYDDKGECAETSDANETAKPPGEASGDEQSGSLGTVEPTAVRTRNRSDHFL